MKFQIIILIVARKFRWIELTVIYLFFIHFDEKFGARQYRIRDALLFMADLIQVTTRGLYCPIGDFHIDPWKPVKRAITTHAHSDHARPGSQSYLCARAGKGILQARIGENALIEAVEYGEKKTINGVTISLHPAGHLLGSAQIRIEHQGEVWVVSGDYKRAEDRSCESFELVPCHTFISEATFALPIYQWPESRIVSDQILQWWSQNKEAGRTSILFAYALGKAQRLLSLLAECGEKVFVHGSVIPYLTFYRDFGAPFPEVVQLTPENRIEAKGSGLVIAPGSAQNTPWIRKLAPYSLGFASGWMRLRGARRRQAVDRGFIFSDHVDWPALVKTIRETGADRIGLTHGNTEVALKWLRENGCNAFNVPTRFIGDEDQS